MTDESIDISSTGHVVVFGTFVKEGLRISVFLGLFEVPNGKMGAGLIFEGLQKRIKEWSLDVEKCISFGSDGCSTMVDHLTRVSTRLKAVGSFLINIIILLIELIWLPCKLLNVLTVKHCLQRLIT